MVWLLGASWQLLVVGAEDGEIMVDPGSRSVSPHKGRARVQKR